MTFWYNGRTCYAFSNLIQYNTGNCKIRETKVEIKEKNFNYKMYINEQK